MATFSPVRCGADNQDYAYTFHFQNESAATTIFYCLNLTFSPQPQFPGTQLTFQVVSGSMGPVLVPPGQTSSCNFNTNGQLQAGQPPFLGVLGPDNSTLIASVCARFWTGGSGVGALIGATEDALEAGINLVESAMDAEDGDPYGAIKKAFDSAKEIAQAAGTLGSNENQYINLIVTPQSGSGGWTLVPGNDTTGEETASYTVNGLNMTVRVDGGGNTTTTQNIYFHYSDNAT